MLIKLFLIVGIAATTITLPAVLAGGYPNYHADFEFVQWDKNVSVDHLEAKHKWWQTASFYQIYPRSFKDSDGDGVGDLNGITQQLPYLQEINITAAWLSPIFSSPMADFGYDISNYTEIASIFGTMQDFEQMMAEAKELGIKIILDFVPNHTSDESEWFRKSAAGDPYYKDFYVWHPGKMVNGSRQPPSNWVSVFRGSAWQWHEGRQEYYLHEFLKKQPDLNYRNEKVREAMKNVMLFWLEKGVSGFRVDAVPFFVEIKPDAEGNYPDEPREPSNNDPDDYGYLRHIYTVDQPETVELIYEWRKVLDDFQKQHGGDDRVILAEAYSSLENVMKYYGNATMEGAQIPFNFFMISWLNNNSNAFDYSNVINMWLSHMPEGKTANWVVGNHDQNRVGSRLGSDRIDTMNMLIFMLPGCSITYNGEEIGMTDVWISWNDTVDPSACNSNPSIYERFSRDPERTPFQWTDGFQSGFSTANKTWLPISVNYKAINVKTESPNELSHLNVFKKLQSLRAEHTIKYGLTEVKALAQNILAVKRSLLNDYTFIVLLNIFDNIEEINLQQAMADVPSKMMTVLVNDKSKLKIGDQIPTSKIVIQPKEALILRSINKLTTTAGYFTYYQNDN